MRAADELTQQSDCVALHHQVLKVDCAADTVLPTVVAEPLQCDGFNLSAVIFATSVEKFVDFVWREDSML